MEPFRILISDRKCEKDFKIKYFACEKDFYTHKNLQIKYFPKQFFGIGGLFILEHKMELKKIPASKIENSQEKWMKET